jgi:hypothetical protein
VPYGIGCQPASLQLALGPQVSEATQQDTVLFTLTNISGAGCDLQGYPGVSPLDKRGLPLPFHVRWGGDQMLTASPPVLVPLRPGGIAYLGVNKNACVGHAYDEAHVFRVIPPNDYQPLSVTTRRYPVLDYCLADDPGHTLDVSPVEPSLRDVLSGHLAGASR